MTLLGDAVLTAILRASPDAILAFEAIRDAAGGIADFRCVLANASSDRMVPPPEGKWEGATLLRSLELMHASDMGPEFFALVAQGQPLERDQALRRPDGTRWLHIAAERVGDGFVAVVTDITAGRRAQRALAASDRLLQTVFETIPHPTFVKDREFRYLRVNRAMAELWQVPPERILGEQSIARTGRPEPEYRTAMDTDREVLEGGQPLDRVLTQTLPNGAVRQMRIRKIPLFDENREIVGLVGTAEDITDRLAAEAALLESEQRFRDLVEGSLQGMAILQDNRIVFGNRAYAEMFGFETIAELVHSGSLLDRVAPHERQRLRDYIQARRESRPVPASYEMECLRRDGSQIWVMAFARIVEWYGKPATQVTFFDITERKRAEQALDASRRMLQTVIDTLPHHVVAKDREGRYTLANRAFLEHYAARREDVVGQRASESPPLDAASRRLIAEHDRIVFETARPLLSQETQSVSAAGHLSHFKVHKFPLLDSEGRVSGLVGVAEDVTAERGLQAARLESEQRFRNLVEGSLQGMAILQDNRIVFGNSAYLRGFGFEDLAAAQRAGTILDFVAPQDRERIHRYMTARRGGSPAPDSYELNLLRVDGTGFTALLLAKTVQWDGKPATQLTFIDITAEATARRAAALAHARLADAIESFPGGIVLYDEQDRLALVNASGRNLWPDAGEAMVPGAPFREIARHALVREGLTGAALEARQQQLEQQHASHDGRPLDLVLGDGRRLQILHRPIPSGGMVAVILDVTETYRRNEDLRQIQKTEALGQLTGGIAHDFNNLLTVILGNADLLEDMVRGNAPATASARMIVQAAQQGSSLTQRLLAFARKQSLQPVELDLNKVVGGMGELIRRTLGEHIEIELIRGGGLWKTLADPSQLDNALLNLAVNARDAMADGGMLTIETANAWLDDAYAAAHADVQAGQYVMLSVTDTGHGMSREVIERAFDPFFTTKGPGQGSGLGLSMVYGFVKQSGGHVKIYSEPGHGTAVKVYLPRYLGPAQPAQPPPAPEGPLPRGAETILVVEDDELVRANAVRQLQGLGYQVVAVENGPLALEALERLERVHLLFTDVVMPGGMNGRQLAEEAQRVWPGLKVLFASGYTPNAIVHHDRLEPGIHLVTKPYRQADLAHKVRRVLDE